MERIVANLATNKVVTKKLQGKEYLVAPVVMMVEGVLVGNQGSIFYAEEDILRSVEAWNHKPLTIGHPDANGVKVSGCTPEMLEAFAVGMVLNTRYDARSKKLKAEAWFDKSRFDQVPDAIHVLNALTNGEKMEVSTGLYVEAITAAGVHKNKAFTRKATAYRPDHLAILPHAVGACSIAEGAGLLANQQAEPKTEETPADSWSIGGTWLGNKIEDIAPDYVIYATNEGLRKQFYEKTDESVRLLGNLIEVDRRVSYEPLVTHESQMDRETLIKHLGDEHKDLVANMSDEQVSAVLKLKTEAPEAPAQPEPAPAPQAPVVNSLADALALAPEADRKVVESALALNQSVRTDLVAKIVANKANAFTADELAAFSTEALQKMSNLAVVANAAPAEPLFAGSGATVVSSGSPLPLPSTFDIGK